MINSLFNFNTNKMETWIDRLPSENDDPLDAIAYLPHGKVRQVYAALYELGHNPTSAYLACLQVCDEVAGDTPIDAYPDLVAELDAVFTPILEALEKQLNEKNRLWMH